MVQRVSPDLFFPLSAVHTILYKKKKKHAVPIILLLNFML